MTTQRTALALALPIVAAAGLWLARSAGAPAPVALPAESTAVETAPAAPAAAEQPAPERADAVARRGHWSAPAGARFRYDVADRTAFRLSQPDMGTQAPAILDVRAQLVATVLDRREGETLVEYRCDAVRFVGGDGHDIAGDPMQEAFAAAAATPALLRIDAFGRPLGYRFAPGLDGDQRNFLRGVIGLLVFEAPAAGVARWTGVAQDNTGDFEARYETLPGGDDESVVRRARLRFTSIRGQKKPAQHVTGGATVARFALDRGWLRAVELDESLRLELDLAGIAAITRREAKATLIAEDVVAVGADLASAWAATVSDVVGVDERTGAYAAAAQRKQWAKRLVGVTVGDLLAEVDRLMAADPIDHFAVDAAFQKLQWLLKGDEAAVRALAAQMQAGQVADRAAGVVIGAFGAVGSPAAQDALIALRGADVPPQVREAATNSCLQVAEPRGALMESLAAEAFGASHQRGQSLMVLGALAPRAAALADGRTPLEALLAEESACAARGELDQWVLAIGNTRTPAALAVALRLLGHESPSVRGACCVVLRNCPEPEALQALLQRGLADLVTAVRLDALDALARRAEPAARSAIESTATLDLDEEVREFARRLLAGE